MQAWQQYFKVMNGVVENAYRTQGDNIMEASRILSTRVPKMMG